ncbi:hypothetical protein RQP46_003004 [Phenoliferia psychrophenolica]
MTPPTPPNDGGRRLVVRCTSEYIKTKPKIDRSGKLIKQAKAIFGGDSEDAPKELQARPRPEIAWNAYVTGKGVSKVGNDPERFAVTEHLLEKYHKIVHPQFTILDWKPFAAMFKRLNGPERKNMPATQTLRDLSPIQDDPEGGNLFWFTLIQDARGATASGRKFFITSDDVVDLCPIAGRLRQEDVAAPANIAHGDPQDVICALHLQVLDAMRLFTLEVTGPVKRRYTIDIEAVVKLWEMIEASVQSTEAFKANMQRSKSSHWKGSLRDITSARVLLAYFLYKNLTTRFASEETEAIRGVAFVEAEDEEYLELLRDLIVEAERKLLRLIKDFTSQLVSLILFAINTPTNSSW